MYRAVGPREGHGVALHREDEREEQHLPHADVEGQAREHAPERRQREALGRGLRAQQAYYYY